MLEFGWDPVSAIVFAKKISLPDLRIRNISTEECQIGGKLSEWTNREIAFSTHPPFSSFLMFGLTICSPKGQCPVYCREIFAKHIGHDFLLGCTVSILAFPFFSTLFCIILILAMCLTIMRRFES
jgi:hypothetical protein